jgi:hypothetical protein
MRFGGWQFALLSRNVAPDFAALRDGDVTPQRASVHAMAAGVRARAYIGFAPMLRAAWALFEPPALCASAS